MRKIHTESPSTMKSLPENNFTQSITDFKDSVF